MWAVGEGGSTAPRGCGSILFVLAFPPRWRAPLDGRPLAGAASIPVVGFNAITTSEHFGAFLTFGVLHAALLIKYIKVRPPAQWSWIGSEHLDQVMTAVAQLKRRHESHRYPLLNPENSECKNEIHHIPSCVTQNLKSGLRA